MTCNPIVVRFKVKVKNKCTIFVSLVVVLGALTTNTNTAIQSGLAQVQGSICPASEVCLYGHRIPCALGDQEVGPDCGRHMNEAQPYIYQQVMRARTTLTLRQKRTLTVVGEL